MIQTSRNDHRFVTYEKKVQEMLEGLPLYEEQIPKEIDVKAEAPLLDEPEKSGFGYDYDENKSLEKCPESKRSGGQLTTSLDDDKPCSKSILDDISRLEVLFGAKRAGNNSPEIINEMTEICQRLFQGHVMDIKQYHMFIDEIIDSD